MTVPDDDEVDIEISREQRNLLQRIADSEMPARPDSARREFFQAFVEHASGRVGNQIDGDSRSDSLLASRLQLLITEGTCTSAFRSCASAAPSFNACCPSRVPS